MLQQDGQSVTDTKLRTEKVLQQDGKSVTEEKAKQPKKPYFMRAFGIR